MSLAKEEGEGDGAPSGATDGVESGSAGLSIGDHDPAVDDIVVVEWDRLDAVVVVSDTETHVKCACEA
jgi:hypothetical protein